MSSHEFHEEASEFTAQTALNMTGRLIEVSEKRRELDREYAGLTGDFLHILARVDLSDIDEPSYESLSALKKELCNGEGLPDRSVDPRAWSADWRMEQAAKGRKGVPVNPPHKPVSEDFFNDMTTID